MCRPPSPTRRCPSSLARSGFRLRFGRFRNATNCRREACRTFPISPEGFRRIHLEPGESKRVQMPLGFDELSFFDEQMKRVVEPGRFEVMVGGSSTDVKKTNLDVVAR
ncbi:MAG TPA: fibronectin type III-like domain-contianing protein [Polyangia bacterium]|nr:fibronectin type III-like domain-contianing protein [Polyangia bacterium]